MSQGVTCKNLSHLPAKFRMNVCLQQNRMTIAAFCSKQVKSLISVFTHASMVFLVYRVSYTTIFAKKCKKMMIYISFLVAAFLLNSTKLLQSHIGTYMLNDSWNSCIASDLPSAPSKVAVESKKYQFQQFAADLAIFSKLMQSLTIAAGH